MVFTLVAGLCEPINVHWGGGEKCRMRRIQTGAGMGVGVCSKLSSEQLFEGEVGWTLGGRGMREGGAGGGCGGGGGSLEVSKHCSSEGPAVSCKRDTDSCMDKNK